MVGNPERWRCGVASVGGDGPPAKGRSGAPARGLSQGTAGRQPAPGPPGRETPRHRAPAGHPSRRSRACRGAQMRPATRRRRATSAGRTAAATEAFSDFVRPAHRWRRAQRRRRRYLRARWRRARQDRGAQMRPATRRRRATSASSTAAATEAFSDSVRPGHRWRRAQRGWRRYVRARWCRARRGPRGSDAARDAAAPRDFGQQHRAATKAFSDFVRPGHRWRRAQHRRRRYLRARCCRARR
ncbi:hypothetical protein FB470_002790 [Amycolatopsis thermophila]|uniref:Uncharacterized protein n=1 Tax=Amycolatopsis thermophila TaxID=206084 RepID=A0ABU0EU05_9PSEU|nr:hypothetical protein [Amycolatopsis thermophila]